VDLLAHTRGGQRAAERKDLAEQRGSSLLVGHHRGEPGLRIASSGMVYSTSTADSGSESGRTLTAAAPGQVTGAVEGHGAHSVVMLIFWVSWCRKARPQSGQHQCW
jgi:hypothetical protein